jgi:hypothetical protein
VQAGKVIEDEVETGDRTDGKNELHFELLGFSVDAIDD